MQRKYKYNHTTITVEPEIRDRVKLYVFKNRIAPMYSFIQELLKAAMDAADRGEDPIKLLR